MNDFRLDFPIEHQPIGDSSFNSQVSHDFGFQYFAELITTSMCGDQRFAVTSPYHQRMSCTFELDLDFGVLTKPAYELVNVHEFYYTYLYN